MSRQKLWLVVAQDGSTPTIHICETEQQRNDASIAEIYGWVEYSHEAQEDLRELRENGKIIFEDGSVWWAEVYLASTIKLQLGK